MLDVGLVEPYSGSAPDRGPAIIQVDRLYYRSGWHEELIEYDGNASSYALVATSPVSAAECSEEIGGCDTQWTTDVNVYFTSGSESWTHSMPVFADGTNGAQVGATGPSPNLIQLAPATMQATGEHVLFATDGETTYWTAGNDGDLELRSLLVRHTYRLGERRPARRRRARARGAARDNEGR